jgi:hypothetical protein
MTRLQQQQQQQLEFNSTAARNAFSQCSLQSRAAFVRPPYQAVCPSFLPAIVAQPARRIGDSAESTKALPTHSVRNDSEKKILAGGLRLAPYRVAVESPASR